ncbi:VF530 family DNA-binding protein [Carboxylicivirga sp. N1Y90]|uniref:VF530 family protein n=1 Tax=Carboxylicivirga fragile TaxID=3417571 RepID=UPI003D32FE8D
MDEDKRMKDEHVNNLLHGVKLVDILERLVEEYGWKQLGERVNIRCFNYDPSIKSSLKFLRRTPWARDEVEEVYLELIRFERKFKKGE